jgi:hypothetical protein
MLPDFVQPLSEVLHIPMNVFSHAHDLEARKYKVFNETQESWMSFRIISILYSIYFFVARLVRWNFFASEGSDLHGQRLTTFIVYEVCDIALMLVYWGIVYLRKDDTGHTLNARKSVDPDLYNGTSMKVFLQDIFIIGITLLFGFWLIMRVAEGQCKQILSLNNFSCNPNQESEALPVESVVVLMLLPMTFCVAFRGTSFSIQLLSWALTLAFIFSTAAYVRINQNVPYILVYAPVSLFLIYESERQNKVIFLVTDRLAQLLEENERLADETHANELRHMVGNVAHDLRTVRHHTLLIPCLF